MKDTSSLEVLTTPFGDLTSLGVGEAAEIASVDASRHTAKRLADMGFMRGAIVEVLRPGAPCMVRIGRTCVGLGLAHQQSILLACRIREQSLPDGGRRDQVSRTNE